MKVLVAREESQRVCIAFREKGHEAYSCDIEPCSGGHPEWHIQDNVLDHLDGWDMIIAFPPCTKTSNAGARHLFPGGKLNIKRFYDGLCGKALLTAIWHADCERIAIENPTPSKIFDFPQPTQTLQPYEFGHATSKRTCLWLKGLPPLKPTKMVERESGCHDAGTWFMRGGKDRQKNRAKTFPGVAKAMADQWG